MFLQIFKIFSGCIYVTAKDELTLKKVAQKLPNKRAVAGNGKDSSNIRILGRRGADVEICVPQGIK
jgi:GTPase involved in cell partitioning and DNA repair